VQVGGFSPYPIDYRSIIPRKEECTNLLVPVCLSATHIAFGSIRMEPVFMVLAQSAATPPAWPSMKTSRCRNWITVRCAEGFWQINRCFQSQTFNFNHERFTRQ